MKNHRISQISDSEDSSESPDTVKDAINRVASQKTDSESSSESEEETRAPTPPPKKSKVSTSPKRKVQSSLIGKFIKENPEFEERFVEEVLSDNDEIFILDVPKTLHPEDFLEKTVNSDRTTKVKLSGKKFLIEPVEDEIHSFNLLTTRIHKICPINIFKVREYVKHKSKGEFVNESVPTKPSLPDNLKVRHPLFGNEYKKKIRLSKDVEKKLDQAIEHEVSRVKKKKKKKVHKEEEPESELDISSIFNSHYSNNDATHLMDEEPTSSNNESQPVKKKKKNKQIKEEISEADASFVEIFENHFESPAKQIKQEHNIKNESKKKKKNKSSMSEMTDTEDLQQSDDKSAKEAEVAQKSGKRRKHKGNLSEYEDNLDYRESEVKNISTKGHSKIKSEKFEYSVETKKEKSRRNSFINSTVIPGLQLPLFDFDMSGIAEQGGNGAENTSSDKGEKSLSPKKQKKQPRIKEEPPSDSSSSQVTIKKQKSATYSPKIKVKQEPQDDEATTSLIMNLLSKVKSEIETPHRHKKKRKLDESSDS